MRVLSTSVAFIATTLLASCASAALVHHYTFDDLVDGGNATDSVGGATGTWDGDAGANLAVPGIIGTASQTNDENGGNGQEHYTTSTLTGLNGATGMSISLWLNQNVDSNNNSTYNGLFMTRLLESSFGGAAENWGVALENNGSPRHIDWRVDGASGAETDNLIGNNVDRWDNVVFVWDGVAGTRSLYQNGSLLATAAAPTGSIVDGASWEIGNDTCCGNREFTGTLDDIAVFDAPLSSDEALFIYRGGLEGLDAPRALQAMIPEPGAVALSMLALAGFGAVGMRSRLG